MLSGWPAEKGWTVKPDGDAWRRVVPSPVPKRIFEIRPIKALLDMGAVVVCTGGGGIPTMYVPGGSELEGPWDFNDKHLIGVEAVIDKDRSSAVLAEDLEADLLVIATDADAVYLGWGTPRPEEGDRGRLARRHQGVRLPGRVHGAQGRGSRRLRPQEPRLSRG